VRLLAVVKANAYGHGAVPCAKAALAAGANWLSVACVDEGLELRTAGIAAPVLVLGYSAPAELSAALQADMSLAVGTASQANAILRAARSIGKPARVHIKIDTGMSRFGFLPDQLDDVGETLARTPEILIEGCFTHFARGEDDPGEATNCQLDRFRAAVNVLARRGLNPGLLHAANSAATLVAPHTHLDMVRMGIAMYGYQPRPNMAPHVRLRPVMEVESCLARVETLPGGSRVGYGHTFVLPNARRIGLVPAGYADGIRRALSGSGYMVVSGARVPIVGAVSMDQCSVDVTEVGSAAEGDTVTIIGAQDGESVWADDLGTWANTIAYEILCGISQRVPRRYDS
jgi:alanine racemase